MTHSTHHSNLSAGVGTDEVLLRPGVVGVVCHRGLARHGPGRVIVTIAHIAGTSASLVLDVPQRIL